MRRVASDQGASYESKVQQQGRDPLFEGGVDMLNTRRLQIGVDWCRGSQTWLEMLETTKQGVAKLPDNWWQTTVDQCD